MPSTSLRRTAASLSLVTCLSLLHVPAAHATPARAAHARSRQTQSQPASHGLLTTLWSYLVSVVTGAPPANQPGVIDPNAYPHSELGALADPNGTL
jgi:hypothetical protein